MKLLSTILTTGALLALWLLFAPAELGGRSDYVVVNGASMEPTLHDGDLAVIRKASAYQVGDIVTYRHPELGTVIHRIVGVEGSRFIVQGENNGWIDSYMPGEQDIAGKLWFDIPGAGRYLELARRPTVLTLLCLVVGAIIMLPGRRNDQEPTPAPRALPSLAGPQGRDLLGLLAVLAAGALLLGGLAFSRPVERQAAREIPYEHRGAFSYSAPAPDGIYDAASVASGEPIFRELVDAFDVQFDYQLTAPATVDGGGTATLHAELLADNGWSRSFELQPPTAFSGSATSLRGEVDLDELQRVITRVEEATGVTARQYRLTIQPTIDFDGAVGDQTLSESFAPALEFQMDAQQLKLARAATDASALEPVAGGLVSQPVTVANTLSLVIFDVDVIRARQIAIVCLGALAVAFGALALAMRRASGRSDAERLWLQFAPRIVRLEAAAPGEYDHDVIEVSSRADFERLLAHHHGPIFQAGGDFLVDHAGRRFRFRAGAGAQQDAVERGKPDANKRPSRAVSALLFQHRHGERRA